MADRNQGPTACPTERGLRYFECSLYEDCLTTACVANWNGFTCEGCSKLDPNKLFEVRSLLVPSPQPSEPIRFPIDRGEPGRGRRFMVAQTGDGEPAHLICVRICPVCGQPAVTRGLCQRHYQAWNAARKKGTAGEDPVEWAMEALGVSRQPAQWKSCNVPGCTFPPYATGLCVRHYYQHRYRVRANNTARMEERGCCTEP